MDAERELRVALRLVKAQAKNPKRATTADTRKKRVNRKTGREVDGEAEKRWYPLAWKTKIPRTTL